MFIALVTGLAVIGMHKTREVIAMPSGGANNEGTIDADDVAVAGSDHPNLAGPASPATGNVATVGNDHPNPADSVNPANPVGPANPATGDVVVATNPAAEGNDEKVQKARKCTELQATKNWQALIDCAKGLEILGDKERATAFKAKAVKEQGNEITAKEVGPALRDRNLKQAETLLAKIGDGSVYYRSLHDQFVKEENIAVEEARRRAQGFANARDCASFERFVLEQIVSSTERVATAVQAVKCTEKNPPPDPSAGIKQPSGGGSRTPPPAPGKLSCEAIDVEHVMAQAANQYSNGFAGAALVLTLKALNCKQDVRMYRLAVMFACGAHDLSNAKVYFAKVPPTLQAGIEQKCQQEGLTLR